MHKAALMTVTAGLMIGCAGAVAAPPVKIPANVPYAEDNEIAGNIKRECPLGEQLGDFIATFAKERGIAVDSLPATDPAMGGRVLTVNIRDAVSSGNAFLGHHKSTSVRGVLYENGKEIGSFRGRRNSMGGAFAGFKGSCSVLGRTVKALGSDIAEWLANPTRDASLGDLE